MTNAFVNLRTAAGRAGTAVTATSITTLLPEQAAQVNVPAEYFVSEGAWAKIRAGGVASTPGSSPGTLTLSVRFGSVVVWSAVTPTVAVSQSSIAWDLDLTLMQYVTGAASALRGRGRLSAPGLVASNPVLMLPSGVLSNGNTFDPANPGQLDLAAHWSVASHSITLDMYAPLFAFGGQ